MILDMYNNYEPYRIFVFVTAFLFGLFIGSFLNVVALRLLELAKKAEETQDPEVESFSSFIRSITFPPSHCPKCNTHIAFYDNIPIISYFLLLGKCRHCKEKISIQYPLVEFSTGILFFLCVFSFGLSIKTAGMILVICALIVLTVTDLYEQYIFDITSIGLIPFGLIYNLFNLGHANRPDFVFPLMPKEMGFSFAGIIQDGSIHLPGIFVSAIVGIVIAWVFFEGTSKLGEIFLGKYGFGMGDTKLCMGLAAWFGWEKLVLIILLCFLAQAIVGLPILFYNSYKDKQMKMFYGLLATIILTAIPFIINLFPDLDKTIALILTLSCFLAVIVSLFIVLKETKKKQSFTYLPLGPAIVIGALVVMFYGDNILSRIVII